MDVLKALQHITEQLQTQTQTIRFKDGEVVTPKPTHNLSDPIETLLDNGIVEFWFREVDGNLRFAIGTRNTDIIKQYSQWAWRGPSPSPKVCAYFDIQRNEWRSFRRAYFLRSVEYTDKADLFE